MDIVFTVTTISLNNVFKHRRLIMVQVSAREARSYTWCDQRFVSVNIAAHGPARKYVILEDFAC